jgi:hypothetical protein
VTLRLAMWSGPRNISTALMRSFGNRPDTAVCDEPLYAHYLAATGAPHPGADEVVRRHESDWREVARFLLGPVPGGKPVFYQKHMAHHLLPEIDRGWLAGLEHAFLIRDPREMLLSLAKVTPRPTLADTGLPQQVELYESVRRSSGRAPPVLDARDVLEVPARQLGLLCARFGLELVPEMLAWPSGPRDTDGVWAKHWYADVLRSTGFEPWRPRTGELGAELARVHAACVPLYEALARHRLGT